MPFSSKEEQREYQRLWIAKRRVEWLRNNGPCAKCGSWINLELDHKERFGKITHRVWSWSATRREAELKKCQVLCEECHKSKSIAEIPILPLEQIKHGGSHAYNVRGCRCSLCKEYRSTRQLLKNSQEERQHTVNMPIEGSNPSSSANFTSMSDGLAHG